MRSPREVWSVIRPALGWVFAGLGAIALFLGWYGVSGEALTAKQLPYLVSGGLSGIGLFILAGVVLATDDVRRQLTRVDDLQRKVDQLYALFVEELDQQPGTAGADTPVVALPGGASYHRSSCTLVAGKADVSEVDARVAGHRGLRPCRVCDPVTLG